MNVARRRPAVAMLARSPWATGKTRLAGAWAEADATALKWALLLDAVEAALAPGWPLHVFVEPAADVTRCAERLRAEALTPAGVALSVHAQAGGDLARRMVEAMQRTLGVGHDAVVLIGSDAPDLPASALHDAASLLDGERADRTLVLGPAADGGFYLVATTRPTMEVFRDVTWSVETVLRDVTERATRAGWHVSFVEPWHDVDTRDDLARVVAAPGAAARRTRAVVQTLGLH